MSSFTAHTIKPGLAHHPLRIGFIPLTDAAPLVAAQELNLFAKAGLHVELQREVGWATIRDKIVYGELEAAHALAPMLWDVQFGLGCPPCRVLTALVLSLNGNALTLSNRLRSEGVSDAATFRAAVRALHGEKKITLGVVFPFSSHHLLLLHWLRATGLTPERDVRIVVVPPAQMFRNLAAGTIDGYCAGEPWNTLAVREGAGWCPMWSAAEAPGHVEKILMVTQRFAETRAAEHTALISALVSAAAWCDEPQNREPLAEMLAEARYLNLPARIIAPALLGRFDRGDGHIESVPDFHVFHRGDASAPTAAKAAALQRQLAAAHLLTAAAAADSDLPRRLFREDLFRAALHQHRSHETTVS